MRFEIKKDSLYLNGDKFRLYSGTMHYFRVLPEYWDDRFAKLKSAGFNAVETVMCWNLHEPKEGEFDFSGMLDIEEFCRTAARHGLYAIVRPGPYTCGEWDFGGFPAWILKDRNIRLRCNQPLYMSKVKAYLNEVCRRLAPLQIDNGGNIIAFQIENEYGSYGNDKEYLLALEKIMIDSGIVTPLFTSDGNRNDMLSSGTLPHVYKTLNFGSGAATAFNALQPFQPDYVKTNMEFWCGWFDYWGGKHHTRDAKAVVKEVETLIDNNINFNIYTFHGGTNFGFTSGANYGVRYDAVVTSYDDAALLNEYGDYTPAYHAVRSLLHRAQNLPMKPLPDSPKLQSVGEVTLSDSAELWESLYRMGEKHHTAHPESMEYFNQNFGFVLYTTTIEGSYPASTLAFEGVHDVAYLRINGKFVKRYSRLNNPRRKNNDGFKVRLPAFEGDCIIELFVQALGRVNYGPYIIDRKGMERALLSNRVLFSWDVYTLPMTDFAAAKFGKAVNDTKPAIMRGKFRADAANGDCFVNMHGFKNGFVVINGFNLGRYMAIGPQRSLYLPAPLLKGDNEIIVVELDGYKQAKLKIIDKHDIG